MNTSNAPTGSQYTEMIDKKTLAQRLGKDLRTISRYMRRGILPYYKLGRTVMFDWEGVKRSLWLLAKNTCD